MLTHCHSSLSSLSARILSRLAPSVSSQRSSSTKVSTNYKTWAPMVTKFLRTHCLVSFGPVKHQICRGPSDLHIKDKLDWSCDACLGLNCFPHLFSLWRWSFLVSNQHRRSNNDDLIYTLTTIALTNPTSSRLVGTCASGFFGSKCGDLLYVDMSACVAKLMTWARQL